MNVAETSQALISDPKTWISAVALVVSSLTFWRTRPALQLKRDQQAQMAVVASRGLSLTLFTAFIQSLSHAFSDESFEPEVWTKQHLLMGMVRLLESCRRYDDNSKSRLGVPLPSFPPDVMETSCSYIHASLGDA